MDPNTSVIIKRTSFAAKVCSCISWKSKKFMSSAHMTAEKWKNFTHKREKQTLPLIFALLLDLYDGQDVYEGLEACRINPDFMAKYEARNDLEYYVPQLTNFLVFHNEFSNEKLQHLLAKLSIADPYFAHLYYWYISSLGMDVERAKGQTIVNEILETCSKEMETQVFVRDYENFYWALEKKLPRDEYNEKIKEIQMRQGRAHQHIELCKSARTKNTSVLEFELKGSDLDLKPYISPFFEGSEAYFSNPFTSTLLFFEDLGMIAQAMNKSDNKLKFLKRRLNKINKTLPSAIYIPFVKDYIRCHAILGIVIDETRVFSTKERAPFLVCLELFKPHEELAHEYNSLFPPEEENIKKAPKVKAKNIVSMVKRALLKHKSNKYVKMGKEVEEKISDEDFKISKIDHLYSSPVTLKQKQELVGSSPTRIDEHRITDNYLLPAENAIEMTTKLGPHQEEVDITEKQKSPTKGNAKTMIDGLNVVVSNYEGYEPSMHDQNPPMVSSPLSGIVSPFHAAGNHLSNYLKNESNEEKESPIAVIEEEKKVPEAAAATFTEAEAQVQKRNVDIFFGEDSKEKAERIRQNSPFKDLRTWRLLNLIVKNGADMKEEQFALQLISQFNQIFKAEKLKLILTDFEIISIGSDIGLVEVVQDAITFSGLKEKMYQQNIPSLNDFFVDYYGKDVDKARKRFCRSLAAYSLICYFLQIKDRHNGNIMLHKEGHIVHIDFGFFLSSAPGKGLEFEKKVPFKLLNEYIEVLGGFRSSLFQEFRKLFYKGFMAARKHMEQILILVKMMYSSQGHNLPCFKAGLKTISDLEQRFCPDGVAEKDLMGYCYNIINQSVDNWRAKCYDKFQYYVQGIHY